ncbi:MAG: hypothetical protein AAGA56_09435, partial [Myxococcota bacterium]
PAVVSMAVYLAIPMVFIGTHVIFPRFGQTVVFGLLFALPRLPIDLHKRMRRVALGLAGAVVVNFAAHMVWFARETNGLSRVIDAIPEGRRVTAVVYGHTTVSFRGGTLVHAAAYYGARKRGDWAYNFARYASVPLSFQPFSQPGWPLKGWEFSPEDYNPHCWYARFFDVVIIRAPAELERAERSAVAGKVFGPAAGDVRLIARDGRYWAFDTEGLFWDGTP